MNKEEYREGGPFFFKDKFFMKKGEYPLPIFENNRVAIVLAGDSKYLPYMMGLLENIIEKSSPGNTYDIIFETIGVSEEVAEFCLKRVKNLSYFSLRFLDHSHLLGEESDFYGVWGIAIMYRILLASTFRAYEKVLSLDADISLQKDISILMKVDLEDYYLAAALDFTVSLLYSSKKKIRNKYKVKSSYYKGNLYNYFIDFLGFSEKEISRYFNIGVVLYNIQKINKEGKGKQLESFLQKENKLLFPEQDIYNVCFKNEPFLILDSTLSCYYYKDKVVNLFYDDKISDKISLEKIEKNKESMKDSLCLHYTISPKAWEFLLNDDIFSLRYWERVSRSPVKSAIILNLINKKI